MGKKPFTILFSVIAFFILCCKPPSASASGVFFYNAKQLLEFCEKGYGSPQIFDDQNICNAYIMGVSDTQDSMAKTKLICLPVEVTSGQLGRIVLKFLKDRPEKLHHAAHGEVILALWKAFPCRKDGQ